MLTKFPLPDICMFCSGSSAISLLLLGGFNPSEKYYRLLPFMCRHRGGEQPLHPPAPSKLPVWGETGNVPLGSHLPSKLPEYVVVNSLELTVGPTEII